MLDQAVSRVVPQAPGRDKEHKLTIGCTMMVGERERQSVGQQLADGCPPPHTHLLILQLLQEADIRRAGSALKRTKSIPS